MSARPLHARSVLFSPATNGRHSKQRHRPSLAHRGKADHRRDRGEEETTGSNDEDYEASWYLPPPDGTEDPPSTTVSQVDEPTPDVSKVNVIAHPPLKILNMTNIPDHPLATNLIMPVPQPSHTTPTSQTPRHVPEKVLLALFVLGGVLLLICWTALKLGSCNRPKLRRRKPILLLPTVRDRKRTDGSARLPSFARNQNAMISQINYNADPQTQTQRQLGTPRSTSPETMGRTTPQGVANNRSATSGQDINAEQERYPFTAIGNCASSSALTSSTTTTPIVSRPTMILVPNLSDHSQLGSEVRSAAIDATTVPNPRSKLVSWNSLIYAVKRATVFRRSMTTIASSDSQTSEAIGRALSKATYYTPSPYPRESIPSPSRSQFAEGLDSQQDHGLGGANIQCGQEREPRTSTPLSSLASPDDATQIIEGMESVARETAISDIAHDVSVDSTALGGPTSVASFHPSASEAGRDLLAGTLRTSLEKEIEDQPSQERPLPPIPSSVATDGVDDGVMNVEGKSIE